MTDIDRLLTFRPPVEYHCRISGTHMISDRCFVGDILLKTLPLDGFLVDETTFECYSRSSVMMLFHRSHNHLPLAFQKVKENIKVKDAVLDTTRI